MLNFKRHLADQEWLARERKQRIFHLLKYRTPTDPGHSPKPLSPSHKIRPASSLRLTGGSSLYDTPSQRQKSANHVTTHSTFGTSDDSLHQSPCTPSATSRQDPEIPAKGIGVSRPMPMGASRSAPNLITGATQTSWSSERPPSSSSIATNTTNTTSLSMMVDRAMMTPSERDRVSRSKRDRERWFVDHKGMNKSDLQSLCDQLTRRLSKERKRRQLAEGVLKEAAESGRQFNIDLRRIQESAGEDGEE